MQTIELVKAVINSHHGWAVADQFEDSYNYPNGGSPFEELNYNALIYIRDVVRSILHGGVLSKEAEEELGDYYDDLENYLAEPTADPGPDYDSAGFTEEDRIVEGQYMVRSEIRSWRSEI